MSILPPQTVSSRASDTRPCLPPHHFLKHGDGPEVSEHWKVERRKGQIKSIWLILFNTQYSQSSSDFVQEACWSMPMRLSAPGLCTWTCMKAYTRSQLIFFFNSVLRPFQDYFSSYETGQSVGGAKTGEPREKSPDTHASRTWLVSHVARAGLEPTPDTAVRDYRTIGPLVIVLTAKHKLGELD